MPEIVTSEDYERLAVQAMPKDAPSNAVAYALLALGATLKESVEFVVTELFMNDEEDDDEDDD